MTRVNFSPKEMADNMFSGYNKFKALLEQALNPAQAGPRLTGASIASPRYDPITATT